MVSKTKIGAGLIGLAAIASTVGAWLSGTLDVSSAVTALITEIGAVITAWGLRDLPIVNRTK